MSCSQKLVQQSLAIAVAISLLGGTKAHAVIVSHWAFDDGTGITAVDSESGYHGTLSNGPVFTTSGKIGSHAILFDGSNDRVVVNDDPGDNLNITGPITISSWINSTNINKVHNGIYTRQDWNHGHSLLVAGDSGSANNRPLWSNNGQRSGGLQSNTWYHVAKTYDGTTTRLFVNGVQVGSQAGGGASSNTHPVLIGQEGNLGDRWSFAGRIDDVAVWNNALTAGEMFALYSLGNEASLNYDAGDIQDLLDAFAAGPGSSVTINGLTWEYATGLVGIDGQLNPIGGGDFELVLNSGAGTGLSTFMAPVPEPASILLWAVLGLIGYGAWKRKRVTSS